LHIKEVIMKSGTIIILTILTIAGLLLSIACPSTAPPTKGVPATSAQDKAAETEATPPSPPEPKPVVEVPSPKDKPIEEVKPSSPEEKTDGEAKPSPQPAGKAPPEPEVLPEYPLTVVDDLTRKVTIKKLPQRIISLAPSNTEILFALGLEDRVVGVTQYCNYPEAAKAKPRVAGYSNPSLEKVISMEPDLILADAIHEKTVLPALEKHKLTVIVMAAKSINTVMDDITLVGKVTGKSKAAARLVDGLNARVKGVTAKTQSLASDERPRILHILWHNPIWTMGSETFIDDLLQKAGGLNIFADEFEKSRVVSIEAVVDLNPQVITVSGMGTTQEQIYSSITKDSRLSDVDAIASSRVYKIDSNLVERSGPRIVDGLEQVARMLHPEIFGVSDNTS